MPKNRFRENKRLVGGFKYFFLFTRIWVRFPIFFRGVGSTTNQKNINKKAKSFWGVELWWCGIHLSDLGQYPSRCGSLGVFTVVSRVCRHVLGVCLGFQILEIARAQLHGQPNASSQEFGWGEAYVQKLEFPHCGLAPTTLFGETIQVKVRHSYGAPVCREADGFSCGNFENPHCLAFRYQKTPRRLFWAQWHLEQCGRAHIECIFNAIGLCDLDAA